MKVTYRAVTDADYEFLYQLHVAAMRALVEDAYGLWDEAWQQAYFRKYYDPEHMQIIQNDGVDVGVLYLQERTEELFIANIEILPVYQRQGIGAQVIREVQSQAEHQGKPVALQVLKRNLPARHLYQRLGFGITGENETHYIMAYQPKMGAG